MSQHEQKSPNDIPDLMDPSVGNRYMADGEADGLEPLVPLDFTKVNDFDELLRAMSSTAFGGRNLGEAADVLAAMIADPDCSVVLTLSGAMTVAKMNLIITEMIERGWVQAIVSTGALITHGLVELTGMTHYKAVAEVDDEELYEKGYNRVYDTYEMEKNLNDLAGILRDVFDTMPEGERFGSYELLARIGEYLAKPGRRGILASAYRCGVPVYIPAFIDSELALDLGTWIVGRKLKANPNMPVEQAVAEMRSDFDPFRDLSHYVRIVSGSPKLGIFTIGGGAPRNWAQQAPPFIDIINHALDVNQRLNRFAYGVRICPEPAHFGGLSGCTYSEGVSWGKFVPPREGGRYAEVLTDATMVWPLLAKGVAQRLEKTGRKPAWPKLDLDYCRPRG